MPRILKPGSFLDSEDFVPIPDVEVPPPLPEFDPTGAPAARGVLLDEAYEKMVHKAREDGEALAQKILKRTNDECGAMIAQAHQDAEEIREQARREGFERGVVEKVEEIAECLGNVVSCLDELRQEQRRYEDEYAQELRGFAADIAEKVLLDEISRDNLCLEKLVRQAVHTVRDADWISIQVSSKLPELVAYLEKELGKLEPGETRIEVEADETLPEGSVVLQTPEGAVDVSVTAQVQNLRELFRDMDREEPER